MCVKTTILNIYYKPDGLAPTRESEGNGKLDKVSDKSESREDRNIKLGKGGRQCCVMSGDRRYIVSGSINVLEGDDMWGQKDGKKIRSRISRGAR